MHRYAFILSLLVACEERRTSNGTLTDEDTGTFPSLTVLDTDTGTEDTGIVTDPCDAQELRLRDVDRDGYGNPDSFLLVSVCAPTIDGLVPDDVDRYDCDDDNADVHPDAEEVCNWLDDDCDQLTDAGDDSIVDGLTFYQDLDRDGHGSDSAMPLFGCQPAPGYAEVEPDDCDDNDSLVNPHAPEICDDGVDGNCNGSILTMEEASNLHLGPRPNSNYCDETGAVSNNLAATSLVQVPIGGGTSQFFYMGADFFRYTIVSDDVLVSWWSDSQCEVCGQTTLTDQVTIVEYVLGGNITIRPGAYIIHVASEPDRRYVIDACATIREAAPAMLDAIYGPGWQPFEREVLDVNFADYSMGPDVLEVADFNLAAAQNRTLEEELNCR